MAEPKTPKKPKRNTRATAVALDHSNAITIGGHVFGGVHVHSGVGPTPVQSLNHYLDSVMAECQRLKLDLIDDRSAISQHDHLRLNAIYTRLMVTAPELDEKQHGPDAVARAMRQAEKAERTSAAAFVCRHPRAVIMGTPGSGKTTLTDFLSLCLAGHLRKDSAVNLSLLGEDWKGEALLPLRITLREYTARSLPKGRSLWQHLVNGWAGTMHDGLDVHLRAHLLQHGGGLIILDGLDEVPEAANCRQQVKNAILALATEMPRVRVLVTSRTYAYRKPAWQLDSYRAAELAAFEQEEWEAFIDRWYAEMLFTQRYTSTSLAEQRRDYLKAMIASRKHLQMLAASPLLLTLMASVQSLGGGDLPDKRVELYQRSVRLLLHTWERPKMVHRGSTTTLVRTGVLEFLGGITIESLETAIAEVAYNAHKTQEKREGVADIREGDLLVALKAIARDGQHAEDKRPDICTIEEYIRDRAGLLIHQDGEAHIYSFPHRTFQEYLAACHLCRLGAGAVAEHLKKDPERWREVYLLAPAQGAIGGSFDAVWTTLRKTCSSTPGKQAGDNEWLCAALAAQLMLETKVKPRDDDERGIRDTIIKAVTELVAHGKLQDVKERAAAGATLGQLGDPRPGVGLRADGVPAIEWQQVPAGAFLYGERKEKQTIAKDYQISRYPVTVAQYQAFVDDGGYSNDAWWPDKEGREWRDKNKITGPKSHAPIFQTPNHPQVGASFYEAEAFCRWLSVRLDQPIRLPAEQEWERAARGTDGREYPWVESSKVETHANISATGIGHTSPVGMFPSGASPADCLDMAGNVWEWTRGPKDACVLRGGSFGNDALYARCANRIVSSAPLDRYLNFGFRVVLSPF